MSCCNLPCANQGQYLTGASLTLLLCLTGCTAEILTSGSSTWGLHGDKQVCQNGAASTEGCATVVSPFEGQAK
eukprot:284603-Pelagomonas_calceolata.AAC.4